MSKRERYIYPRGNYPMSGFSGGNCPGAVALAGNFLEGDFSRGIYPRWQLSGVNCLRCNFPSWELTGGSSPWGNYLEGKYLGGGNYPAGMALSPFAFIVSGYM